MPLNPNNPTCPICGLTAAGCRCISHYVEQKYYPYPHVGYACKADFGEGFGSGGMDSTTCPDCVAELRRRGFGFVFDRRNERESLAQYINDGKEAIRPTLDALCRHRWAPDVDDADVWCFYCGVYQTGRVAA